MRKQVAEHHICLMNDERLIIS